MKGARASARAAAAEDAEFRAAAAAASMRHELAEQSLGREAAAALEHRISTVAMQEEMNARSVLSAPVHQCRLKLNAAMRGSPHITTLL